MQPLILVLTHEPSLFEQIAVCVNNFTVQRLPATFNTPLEAVAYIADRNSALLIMELDQPISWLAEVRMNPATRRIPLIALGEAETTESYAMNMKAVALFTSEVFIDSLPDVIYDHARIFKGADALAEQCQDSPPPLVLKGLHEFNMGEYYECHETLETAWKAEEGPVRELYRAILQVGVAYYQITRGNYNGAYKMFLRSLQWFASLPDVCQGINVAQLRTDADAVRAHLESLGAARIGEFDRSLLKPIQFEEIE